MTNTELCRQLLRPIIVNILETMEHMYDLSESDLDKLEIAVLDKAYDMLFDLTFYEVKNLHKNGLDSEEE